MNTTTPSEISKAIIKLGTRLVSKPQFTFVDIVPEMYSIKNECYNNVEYKVKEDGGKIQYGWQIWEWPSVYIEAEFHAIWISPNNDLLDITPKDYDVTKILFLTDLIRKYENRTIDNVRLPLKDDKLIKDYLEVAKRVNLISTQGESPNNPGITTVNLKRYEYWISLKAQLQLMLQNKLSEYDLCFCKSGKKYKNCHSKSINWTF